MTDTDAKTERRTELAKQGLILRFWAEETPDKPAIISDAGSRTFAELDGGANQLVRALRARGITAGDAIALLCTNRPAFAETVAACSRGGFRLTPINWHLTGEEAAYIVGDCEAKVLIADARLAETAIGAAAQASNLAVKLAVGGEIDGFDSYEKAVADESSDLIDDPTTGSQMLYTSGTTGRPKGVYRPPLPGGAAAAAAAAGAMNIYGYAEYSDDMHLCTGPLYHAAPLAFSLAAPLAFGCGVVLMEKWDAEEALRLITEYKVTHTHMVPTMFHRLLSLPDDVRAKYDTTSMRYVLHGAAPCPVPVKQQMIEWVGPIIIEYYGATEANGFTWCDSEQWLAHPGTVGKPIVGQLQILDDDGKPCPTGTPGTVWFAGATNFEYFNDPDKTKESRDESGTSSTVGDVGYVDEDGYLYLTDRKTYMIISGGVNIYPQETENLLITHPKVLDAAVIGVPNEDLGEEVKAVVQPADGVEPGPELELELIAFCRENLAHFKCPRSVDFEAELPRLPTGKLYKRLLRDRYWQQRGSVIV